MGRNVVRLIVMLNVSNNSDVNMNFEITAVKKQVCTHKYKTRQADER